MSSYVGLADAVGPTPGRCPTTARHGDSWLLGLPPGPVRPSLVNLASPDSSGPPMPVPSSVRTSSLHGPKRQSSRPQTILRSRPPCRRITGDAALPVDWHNEITVHNQLKPRDSNPRQLNILKWKFYRIIIVGCKIESLLHYYYCVIIAFNKKNNIWDFIFKKGSL